ncbi:MAG: glycosyltransferase [Bryobacteraceae bacterium]
MKILWVNNIFLHPTTKGGQIRTLEMIRRLHRRHEVHYVAFENDAEPESIARSKEYCSNIYPVSFRIAPKLSPRFFSQVALGFVSPTPIVVERKRSAEMQSIVQNLIDKQRFDSLVCDFLTPSINLPNLAQWVLFQHNVETMIFRRYAENAPDGLRRWYFKLQAERLFRYERNVCQAVRHVVAVSENDERVFREQFGVERVTSIPTGVDLDYFAPPDKPESRADLVFVGSMDWMPNIDGMSWFVDEILPLIRRRKPDCSVAIVGRTPVPKVQKMAHLDPLITVTGTVPDVRPYMWGSRISIVPLRIGGGTRLKIYEAMAARVPVVSTTVGAEGLETHSGRNIWLADTPQEFAERCVELLNSAGQRKALAGEAWQMVADRYSWDSVTQEFEEILNSARVR